jgi:D-alanine-D-alanine ligase
LSEIRFGRAFEGKHNIVSYRAKWEPDSPECVDSPSTACTLDAKTEAKVVATALSAFEAVDCRDYGRVDIRLTPQGDPFVIDINPNCDLHPDAGFAKAAAGAGIDYPDLALRLVEIALERDHGNTHDRRPGPGTAGWPATQNRNLLTTRGNVRPRAHRPRAQAK